MSSSNNEQSFAVNYSDIISANTLIKPHIIRTPCEYSQGLSEYFKFNVYLKDEGKQLVRSYKARGASNTLLRLSEEQKKIGVICASAGNHALAVCYYATKMKIPVTVCMPISCSRVKYLACVKTGANVVLHGTTFGEAKQHAEKLVQENGFKYINGYDDPHIIAGQGTIGIEVLEDVPNVDTIIVPVGGGGMIAGIATYVKEVNPKIKIFGVQTDLCNSMLVSLKNDVPSAVNIDFSKTIAEGLGVSLVGSNSFKIVKSKVDSVDVVGEDYVALAALKLFEYERCVVEGAGASSIAYALTQNMENCKNVVCILSGGNIDSFTYSKLLMRGCSIDKRVKCFSIKHPSKGSTCAEIIAILTKHKACILNMNIKNDFYSRKIPVNKMECEIEMDDFSKWELIKNELLQLTDVELFLPND